jgi:hypothetical protein
LGPIHYPLNSAKQHSNNVAYNTMVAAIDSACMIFHFSISVGPAVSGIK